MYPFDHPLRTYTLRQRWRLVSIGWMLLLVGSLLLGDQILHTTKAMSDFTQDYMAALALRQHQSIYVTFANDDVQHVWMLWSKPLYISYAVQNFHPPFLAMLFVPLTWLPYDVAILAWGISNVLLYLWLGALVLRVLNIRIAKPWRLSIAGAVLCWYPLQAHVALGQVSLLLIGCVIGGWVLLRQKRDIPAGALIGLACMIKLFPGLLLLYFIVRRRWRAAASMVLVAACIGIVSLVWVGPADTFYYVSHVLPEDVRAYGLSPLNYSFSSAIDRLFTNGPWTTPLVVAPQLADMLVLFGRVAMLGALILWLVRLPSTPFDEDAGYAVTCVAMLLLSPITWQHIFPLLFLPIGLLIKSMIGSKGHRDKQRIVMLLALFSLPDVTIVREAMIRWGSTQSFLPWYINIVCLPPTIGLLLLWWWLVHGQRRWHADPAASLGEVVA